MSSSCNIVLENYNGVFYPGQTVIGRVECFFHSEKKVQGIHVRLKAKANVRWSERESTKDGHKTVYYWAEEEYFSIQINLIQVHGESATIPAGSYSYPFQYILPNNLPSSFEGNEYNIRYTIKATVDRPWKFDYEAEAIYNVLVPIDLNYMPQLKNPISGSDDKTICCCCCKSGPVEMEVNLPQGGFAVGQKFLISCYISNMSNINVEGLEFKIKHVVDYTSHSPRTKVKTREFDIFQTEESGVGAHGENTLNVEMEIPNNFSVPNIDVCGIIKSRYYFKAIAILPCPHTNLVVKLPITLGHVALHQMPITANAGPTPAYQQNEVPVTSPVPDMSDYSLVSNSIPPPIGMPMPMPTPLPSASSGPPPPINLMSMPVPSMPYPQMNEKGIPPQNYGHQPYAPPLDMNQSPSAPPVMDFTAPPPSYSTAMAYNQEKKPN